MIRREVGGRSRLTWLMSRGMIDSSVYSRSDRVSELSFGSFSLTPYRQRQREYTSAPLLFGSCRSPNNAPTPLSFASTLSPRRSRPSAPVSFEFRFSFTSRHPDRLDRHEPASLINIILNGFHRARTPSRPLALRHDGQERRSSRHISRAVHQFPRSRRAERTHERVKERTFRGDPLDVPACQLPLSSLDSCFIIQSHPRVNLIQPLRKVIYG